jgi:hypothetical protein
VKQKMEVLLFYQNQEQLLNPTLQLSTKSVSTKDIEIILHKRVAEVKWQVTHTLQYN